MVKYTIQLRDRQRTLEVGDVFRQSSGFIGMIILCPEHMTPYMIIDMYGNVIVRSTSIGLCLSQLASDSFCEYIGRILIVQETV